MMGYFKNRLAIVLLNLFLASQKYDSWPVRALSYEFITLTINNMFFLISEVEASKIIPVVM